LQHKEEEEGNGNVVRLRRLIRKVTICTLSLGILSLPMPSFSGIRKEYQSKDIFIKSLYEMLQLSMKC
jgi:hypothetical protein